MLELIRRVLRGRQGRWESLCARCGLCCYQKEIRGRTVITNWRVPCRFLDESTKKCTVYESRFEACADCRKMTLSHALFTTWLPESCGYVRKYRRSLLAAFWPRFFPPWAAARGTPAGGERGGR